MISKAVIALGVGLYKRWLGNKDNSSYRGAWRAWLAVNGDGLLDYVITLKSERDSLKKAASELIESQHTIQIYLGSGHFTTSEPKYEEAKVKALKELLSDA